MSRDESRLVKRAGFNVIGLYRKYGRLSTDPPDRLPCCGPPLPNNYNLALSCVNEQCLSPGRDEIFSIGE